jgi:UDP-glucose 4-epimerase
MIWSDFMKDGRPVVLVTGASGFIGRHLVKVLETNGWRVRQALRTSTGRPDDVLIETIGAATDWQAALVGVEAVVHLAARVHHPNEEHAIDLYRGTNIEGTLHLARCAANAGTRQFIFISTILVNGRSTDGRGPFSESDILTPRGVYGKSKAAAESGLEAMAHDGMRITVIRPPLVYGAGAKGNFRLLFQAVRRGIPLPFGSIRNRRAFLAVENLGSFVVDRLAHSGKAFDLFIVADEEQVSTPEFIRRLARAASVSSLLLPMPVSLLSPLLKFSGRRDAHDSIIGSLELNVTKATSTGWRPQVTLDEGLRLATRGKEWLQLQNPILPRF